MLFRLELRTAGQQTRTGPALDYKKASGLHNMGDRSLPSLPSVATMIDRQRRIEAQGEVSFTTCSQAPRRVLHSIGGIEGPMSSRLGRTTKGGRKNRKS